MENRIWNEELSVGCGELDRQHKQLLDHLNAIGRYPNDLADTLGAMNRFGDAAFDHFAGEERFMAALGYSELNQHRMRHQSFARLFAKVLMNVQSQDAWHQAALQTQQTLYNWLVTEIHDMDLALGQFLDRNLAPITA